MEGKTQCLQDLTRAVCRTINVINEALGDEDKLKRDKRASRALKELEVINDEAMRSGLGLSVNQMVQQKTRSRSPAKSGKGAEPKEQTPFQQLMAHHAKHLAGPIPDGGAQGSAIKWILQYFAPEWAIQKYDAQLKESWRDGKVSWLTVKQEIGRMQTHATRTADATERNAERLSDNFDLIEELRSEAGGDNHEVEHGPPAVH